MTLASFGEGEAREDFETRPILAQGGFAWSNQRSVELATRFTQPLEAKEQTKEWRESAWVVECG